MVEDAGREPEPVRAAQASSVRERRERIREQVTTAGFTRIEALAEEHQVSQMTIHRDLDALERQGWLRRIRGGATAVPSDLYHGDVRHRMHAMVSAKAQIAEAAANLVQPGMSMFLDDSTTALQLAPGLPARGPLTVVTNFLAAVNQLAGQPDIDLIALGGTYYAAYDAFLGPQTVESIRPLHADLLFMSTTAVTEGSCYHQSQDTVVVKRALMESAARTVLLIDHSKFAKRGLHRLAALTDFDLVVVDAGADQGLVRQLRGDGVQLLVAGRDDPAVEAARLGAAAG